MLLDREKFHDDLRLLHMAIRQRWEIDDDFKAIAMARLKAIVTEGDDEIALKAIAEARHMESQNQKDEHKKLDEFSQLIIDVATREGVDLGAIGLGTQANLGASESDDDFTRDEE